MVSNNTDPMETAFTVSVDLRGNGVTTGISAGESKNDFIFG
jgi:3,4-dihydroxy 2-butanone 4-phosphate synthase/GTP cyclohydrolase II